MADNNYIVAKSITKVNKDSQKRQDELVSNWNKSGDIRQNIDGERNHNDNLSQNKRFKCNHNHYPDAVNNEENDKIENDDNPATVDNEDIDYSDDYPDANNEDNDNNEDEDHEDHFGEVNNDDNEDHDIPAEYFEEVNDDDNEDHDIPADYWEEGVDYDGALGNYHLGNYHYLDKILDEKDLENDIAGNTNTNFAKLENYESFNIVNVTGKLVLDKIFKENNQSNDQNNQNNNLYNINGVVSPGTGKQFTDSLSTIFIQNCISPAIVESIMNELSKQIPILNIPWIYSERKQQNMFYLPNTSSNATILPDRVYICEFDVCRNSCKVFLNSDEMFCNICTAPRYKYCKKCYVRDGFIKPNNCTEHSDIKIPSTIMKYRSVKLLIIELLQYKSFRKLIFYKPEQCNDETYFGLTEGNSYQSNMNRMNNNFEDYKKDNPNRKDAIQISLCCSWFYDGVQLFKKLVTNFSPIFITILNLPPNLRDQIGIGTFLLSYFTLKKKSVVESFLLEKCLIGEFIEFFKGFEILIDGVFHFIQIAMIMHLFDLAQLCPLLGTQAMQSSHAGCSFCNLCKGTTLKTQRTENIDGELKLVETNSKIGVKYIDTRKALGLRNILRYYGMSRNDISDTQPTLPTEANVKGYTFKQVDYRNIKLHIENTKHLDLLRNFLKKGNKGFIFFNSDIADISVFDEYLYYQSCWLGPFVKHKSTSTKELRERETHRKTNNLKCYKTVIEEGILLKFPNFNLKTDCTAEKCHVFKGVLLEVIFRKMMANLDNDPLVTKNAKNYYNLLNLKMFPKILKEKVPISSFNELNKHVAEATLKCVLVPMSCSSKLIICKGRIFHNPGQIEIANIITIFTVYMNLILLNASNVVRSYKMYYRLIAAIVIRLIGSAPFKSDIEPLKHRIFEGHSLTEGMFPANVMTYMIHALVDSCEAIKDQGPFRESHGLHGERDVGKAKRMVKIRGGTKYDQLAYKKFFEKELQSTEKFYSEFNDNMERKDSTSQLKLDDDGNVLYNYKVNSLTNHSKFNVDIEEYEFDQINSFIKKQIFAHFNGRLDDCLSSSSFYRVMYYMQNNIKPGQNGYKFMNDIVQAIEDLENRNILRCLHSMHNLPNDTECDSLFKLIRKNQGPSETLYDAIEKLYTAHDYCRYNSMSYLCIQHIIRNVNDVMKINNVEFGIIYGNVNQTEMLTICHQRFDFLLLIDYITLKLIRKNIMSLKISEYAIIHGINHYGRGFRCSEKLYAETNAHVPTNEFNDLSQYWFQKHHYSSWCKVNTKEKDMYGQLNYFFTPNIPTDEFVSTILIASITCRRASIPNLKVPSLLSNDKDFKFEMNCIDFINGFNWQRLDSMFLNFSGILPTRVATIGFVRKFLKNNKIYFAPIITKYEDMVDERIKILIKKGYVHKRQDNTNISYLGLMDISPENLVEKENEDIHEMIRNMNDLENINNYIFL